MIDLIKRGVISDGGTEIWVNPTDLEKIKTIEDYLKCPKYHIDYRLCSPTKGELYDRYPSDEGSLILDKTKFNFKNK